MFCTNCGKQIEDDVEFCPNCGKKLKNKESNTTTISKTLEVNSSLWMGTFYKGWGMRLQRLTLEEENLIIDQGKLKLIRIPTKSIKTVEQSFYASPLALISGILCSLAVMSGISNFGESAIGVLVLFGALVILAVTGFNQRVRFSTETGGKYSIYAWKKEKVEEIERLLNTDGEFHATWSRKVNVVHIVCLGVIAVLFLVAVLKFI